MLLIVFILIILLTKKIEKNNHISTYQIFLYDYEQPTNYRKRDFLSSDNNKKL